MDQPPSKSSLNPTVPKDEAFKVIIIGGGVGGLILAHCLDRAGIDYIVLDKHPIAPAWGASITIHPSSSRILDQLGLLDDLDEICTPMYNFWNRTPGGKDYLSGAFFDGIRKRAGYLTYTLERRRFLQLLYDRLPERETKVVPNARVDSIELVPSNTSGITKVQAILSDGTSHTGDLVVGADGVYSTVRAQLWSLADQLQSKKTTGVPNPIIIKQGDREAPIKTTYYGLTGISPMTPEFKAALGDRDMTSVSGSQVGAAAADGKKKIEPPYSMLFLTQPDMVYWIVHFKMPQPANTGEHERERRKFTDRDADLVAQRFVAARIASHSCITFRDIWDSRLRGHLVPLQEGFFPNLHAPGCRIALLGDAAHKVTPNAAWGGNMAVEDAVVLANELVRMVRSMTIIMTNQKPGDDDVDLALGRYDSERAGRVKEIVWLSGLLARLQAWDGWGMWFLQRWLVPLIGIDIIASQIAKSCVEAPKLTFITERVLDRGNMKIGTLEWKYQGLHTDEAQELLTNTDKGFVGKLPRGRRLYWGPVLGVIMSIMVVYVAMI